MTRRRTPSTCSTWKDCERWCEASHHAAARPLDIAGHGCLRCGVVALAGHIVGVPHPDVVDTAPGCLAGAPAARPRGRTRSGQRRWHTAGSAPVWPVAVQSCFTESPRPNRRVGLRCGHVSPHQPQPIEERAVVNFCPAIPISQLRLPSDVHLD